jgi:hypothetical protein
MNFIDAVLGSNLAPPNSLIAAGDNMWDTTQNGFRSTGVADDVRSALGVNGLQSYALDVPASPDHVPGIMLSPAVVPNIGNGVGAVLFGRVSYAFVASSAAIAIAVTLGTNEANAARARFDPADGDELDRDVIGDAVLRHFKTSVSGQVVTVEMAITNVEGAGRFPILKVREIDRASPAGNGVAPPASEGKTIVLVGTPMLTKIMPWPGMAVQAEP